jgi:hypothetical protein
LRYLQEFNNLKAKGDLPLEDLQSEILAVLKKHESQMMVMSFQFNTSLFLGFRSFLKTHALGLHFLILVLQLLIFDIHLVNLGLPLCCFMLGLLSATQIKVKTLRTCILAPS